MMKSTDTTLAILALWLIPGLGPVRIQRLVDSFSNVNDIFNSSLKSLTEILGGEHKLAEQIPGALESSDFKLELDQIERNGVKVLDFTQTEYPDLLREIYNPPPVLYVQGELQLERKFCLAFVGSRKASYSGKSICKRLIKDLARKLPNTIVISGLALGIDTSAHEAALENNLQTIGVLANGLSEIYPLRNKKLASKVIQNGALVTEFPMTSKPIAKNFPLRNRIISGLSKGVVIVEAGIRSGASITAGYALEQNRELFALPGPADSQFHKGTNRLIQKGQAKLVMDIDDVLEEFNLDNEQLSFRGEDVENQKTEIYLSKTEEKVLELLGQGCCQKDQLIRKADLPVPELLSALVNLEIKGIIISKPGAQFEIVPQG